MANPTEAKTERRRTWGLGRDSARRTSFRDALDALVAPGEMVNILQIGANDGLINDPLHGFLRAHPDRTQIILVEPQADLIPILSDTYAFHPRKIIREAAVGPAGRLTLYRLRKQCWPDLVLGYGKHWPIYRAPTGVTSGDRGKVEAWASRHYRGPLPLAEVVEAVEVASLPSSQLIDEAALFQRLDVLQVDVEGFDDHVIRQADIPRWRPRLIHYENEHLGDDRQATLATELDALGYRLERLGRNTLATRRD